MVVEILRVCFVILSFITDFDGFNAQCSLLSHPKVVGLLNNMYLLYDYLQEQNQLHKLRRIGDACLVVAGCPVKTTNHALRICDMALDMVDGMSMMRYPGTDKSIDIKIGCHTGPIVAGLVGLKIPR